jgi:hypothetical protein
MTQQLLVVSLTRPLARRQQLLCACCARAPKLTAAVQSPPANRHAAAVHQHHSAVSHFISSPSVSIAEELLREVVRVQREQAGQVNLGTRLPLRLGFEPAHTKHAATQQHTFIQVTFAVCTLAPGCRCDLALNLHTQNMRQKCIRIK